MPCLVITTGAQAGNYYPLQKRPISGGRDPSQEIQLHDAKVSRRHFVVRPDGDHYVIVETKAKNGVYVNGKRVKEWTLREGDEIRVGNTILTYHNADEPDRSNALLKYRDASREFRENMTVTG